MPFHHPLHPRVRKAAGGWLAAGALLASCPPAAGQEYTPPIIEPVGACDSVFVNRPYLRNIDEVERRAGAMYPPDLRRYGVRSGEARFRLRVLADGSVDPASVVIEGASMGPFVEVAKTIAPTLRFSPAVVDGTPVPAWFWDRIFFYDPEVVRSEGSYELSPANLPTLQNEDEVMRELADRAPGATGVALVQIDVRTDGTVDSRVARVEMTTDPALEGPAMAVTGRMRFTPARIGPQPVSTTVSVPILFGRMPPEGCRQPRP